MLPRMESTTARSNPPAELLILCRNVQSLQKARKYIFINRYFSRQKFNVKNRCKMWKMVPTILQGHVKKCNLIFFERIKGSIDCKIKI
jgi:hypothetical protein